MINIALFGTSADPPTEGHKAILRWLCDRYDWVAVWASDNPYKTHQTSLDHRMTMLQLLIMEMDVPRNNISVNPEISSPKTIETVQKAREKWGENVRLTLAIGSDLLKQMPHWYRIQDLLQQVQLLIVPRPGYAIDEEKLRQLQNLGGQYKIANLTPPNISSTAYRDRQEPSAITPTVKDYIHQEQLYAWQKAAQTQ